MQALVTGASGFIGRHLVAALAGAGAHVRAYGRESPPPEVMSGDVEFVAGDVRDHDGVRRAVADCDAVFHLAALYSFRASDAAAMQSVNVDGTRTVLDAALRGRKRRIVHTSTCATCGPVSGRPANEHDLPPPSELTIPYRRTKLEGERLALDASREGADVLVVNPTVPVGPGDERPTPTGKMIADVASGRARAYLADSMLNVVAVEDVAAGHVLAYEHGDPAERYLLGGENMTIQEVFAIIAAAAGRPAPQLPVPWSVAYAAARVTNLLLRPLGREPDLLLLDEVRSGRLPHRFDDSKARSELGYTSRPGAEALVAAVRGVASVGSDYVNADYRVTKWTPR